MTLVVAPPSGTNGPTASTFGLAFPHLHWLSFAAFSQLLMPAIPGLAIILAAQYTRSPWRRVPPGPRGLPILGNALQLRDKRWMFDKDCKKKFENIMYLSAFGNSMVIFNSLKPAAKLLDRRANISSDRLRFIVANEILCGGLFFVLMSNGDLLRRIRRAAHEMLTKSIVRDYHPIFCKEATILTASILKNPKALNQHFKRATASATMSILYGHPTLEDENDESITEINLFTECVSAAGAPGAHLVDLLPWMVHIPERFARWKREGLEHFRRHTAMFNGRLKAVYDDIAKGSERPSVSASLIKNSDRNGLSHDEMAWLLATLYSAGAETTTTTLIWWVLAMMAHPGIQQRAQDELDIVVGRFRPPTFSDAPNLPYVQAMVKETLRWRPALPLGVPHKTTEDVWYEGMFIPEGTICSANMWQCNHDPALYGDDAADFNPGRFLDEHGSLIPGPAETHDDGHCTYGFGRRACVGKHAANESLFITMAIVLWAVKLKCPRDENGKEVPLDLDTPVDIGAVFFEFRLIGRSRPVPYRCNATARFAEAPRLLAEQMELMKA